MQVDDSVSIGERVVTSTLWMGGWRWSARLIGFVTTIILARLLVPEDFGIVATAGILVALFTTMIDLGTDNYLIRHTDPDDEDYNTAWTLRVLIMSVASLCVFLAAAPGADFFGDQRLVEVVQLLALVGWLVGFTNIGMTMYRRELQFRKVALIGITQRVSASVVTVALAFWLKNYWAIVIGEAVFILVGLLLSFTHHPYRPRFTLSRFHQQWDFSKWIVVRNLGSLLRTQGDGFIIAKFFGIELMGLFSMGSRFAALPTMQLVQPVLGPVYSGLSKKQHNHDEFVASTLKVLCAMAAVMFPMVTLFASLDEALVRAVLGPRWLDVIPLIAPLTISAMLGMLSSPVGTALTVHGRVKLLAGLNWFAAVFVLLALLLVAQWRDIEILVWSRVLVGFLLMLVFYHYFRSVLRVPVTSILGALYRPVLASMVMAVVLDQLAAALDNAWLILMAGTLAGGVVYVLAAALLWRLAGAPESGEALLLRKLAKIMARLQKQ